MNTALLFKEVPTLCTDEIVLHQITDKDSDDLFNIYSNETVFKYCGILVKKNRDTVRKMIEHFERDFRQQTRIKLGIYLKDSDTLIGIIEIMDINKNVNMATIGYFLAERYWNKGYATKAVGAFISYLFKDIEINRIQAEVMLENVNSEKVLIKNGFVMEGIILQGNFWSGKGLVDLKIFRILKEEYKK